MSPISIINTRVAGATVSKRSDSIDQVIGKKVRERRLALGISMQVLAKKIDKTAEFVDNIENGRGECRASSLLALDKALDAPVNYFLDGGGADAVGLRVNPMEHEAVKDALALLKKFYTIEDPAEREVILKFVDALLTRKR